MSIEIRRIAQERLGLYALDHTASEHPEVRDVTLEDIKAALQDAYLAGEASAKYVPPRCLTRGQTLQQFENLREA